RPHIETRSFLAIKRGPAGIGHFGPGRTVARHGKASAVQGSDAASCSGWLGSLPFGLRGRRPRLLSAVGTRAPSVSIRGPIAPPCDRSPGMTSGGSGRDLPVLLRSESGRPSIPVGGLLCHRPCEW